MRAIFTLLGFLSIGALTNSCERLTEECPKFARPPASEFLPVGNLALTLGPPDDQRQVILHIPPTYSPDSQSPLLIVLHGRGQEASAIQDLTGLDTLADQYGFVVAYPNGSGEPGSTQLSWNAGHCCGYALENNIDDVGYVETLIDFFVERYAIDPDRIYLAGLSNGGMLAYRAAAELSAKVAGIAPVAASLGGQLVEGGETIIPDPPAVPVAVIAFHGLQDTRVLYAGGIGTPEKAPAFIYPRGDIPVAESIAFWVEANSCDSVPSEESLDQGKGTVDRYENCQGDADVVLVTLVDGCHEWPTSGAGGRTDGNVCASQMMLEFFLEHPKKP
jgi:polyhydroxybutyrate depolymerase